MPPYPYQNPQGGYPPYPPQAQQQQPPANYAAQQQHAASHAPMGIHAPYPPAPQQYQQYQQAPAHPQQFAPQYQYNQHYAPPQQQFQQQPSLQQFQQNPNYAQYQQSQMMQAQRVNPPQASAPNHPRVVIPQKPLSRPQQSSTHVHQEHQQQPQQFQHHQQFQYSQPSPQPSVQQYAPRHPQQTPQQIHPQPPPQIAHQHDQRFSQPTSQAPSPIPTHKPSPRPQSIQQTPQQPLEPPPKPSPVIPKHHVPEQRSQTIPVASPVTQNQTQTPAPAPTPAPVPSPSPAPTPTPVNRKQAHPQVVIQKQSSSPAPSLPLSGPVNQQHLLLSLADEYINAAHEIGFRAAAGTEEVDSRRYYKLMATGLRCIEILLKSFKLSPRQEAILTLRYVSLVFTETENYRVAEEALTKGVTLCQRYRLFDLQYSLQHMRVRMLLDTNARAALKAIDGPLAEAEASKHVPWVYAFRFLKVSTHLVIGTHSDIASAIQILHGLSSFAKNRRDVSMYITATTFEALLHLRNPGDESIQQAQQAIAAARSYQLGDQAVKLSPIFALLDMVDLACSLQSNVGREASMKMTAMHHTIDERVSTQDPNGTESFSVQLDRSSGQDLTLNTGGIFEKTKEGREALCFAWLNRRDIYILAYFLCGVASFLPAALDKKANPQDKTAEQYLRMALTYVHEAFKPNNAFRASLSESYKRQKWLRSIEWLINLQLTFLYCGKKDWNAARDSLQILRESAGSISTLTPEACDQLTTYLDGIIHQGQGDVDSAIAAFRSPVLSLPQNIDARKPDISTDLRILAALNSVLILLDPNHPEHFLCDPLISAVEPLCSKSPNKNIHAALNLIKSTATSLNSIVKRKQYLASAITSAKETNNHQILCICLTMLSEAFFRDSISVQAEKSALSASNMAQKWGDPVWMCITASLCSTTFENQGRIQEAAAKMRLAYSLQDKLPEPLKKSTGG